MEESGDRFMDIRDALDRVVNHDDFPDGPVERIDIRCTASGEAVWRVWTPRAEEPLGGHIAAS